MGWTFEFETEKQQASQNRVQKQHPSKWVVFKTYEGKKSIVLNNKSSCFKHIERLLSGKISGIKLGLIISHKQITDPFASFRSVLLPF